MKKRSVFFCLLFVLILAVSVSANYLETLQPDQEVNGFITKNLYVTGDDKAMGARFISKEYGLVVDLLQIQSVPQAFYWVKTPPTSSMGEPHTCEHLILGKGNRGRYVSTLEDMSLGSSSAYTSQVRTCYHFHAKSGAESFYDIFEAKLDAFLHPDFSDEEIRREVCHIGVNEDPETGELSLDEKGTVYTEMITYYEKPWKHYYDPLNAMVYGEGHELYNSSGGEPSAIRQMVPADMWEFITDHYHLANMGVIVSIPDNMPIDDFLNRLDGIMKRVQEKPTHSDYVGISSYPYKDFNPAPEGEMRLVQYPSESDQDKGRLYFAWSAHLDLDFKNMALCNLFMTAFGGSSTSNMYKLFVDSEARKIDLGANNVWSYISDEPGNPFLMAIEGIDNNYVTEQYLDSVRSIIQGELKRIHDFADGSEELAEFNREVTSHLEQNRKRAEDNLNSPPMFGFRSGPAGSWLRIMEFLESDNSFRKSLTYRTLYDYADSLLATETNFWRGLIDDWKLLSSKPYAVGASPSTEILAKNAEEKQKRINGYIEDFKKKYGVDNEQAAIAAYKAEFDSVTVELEKLAAKQDLPEFTDNPPLTLDDNLKYEVLTLDGNIPMVASTFESMSSATIGLAFKLDVIPEDKLIYVSSLPGLLTGIGIIENGEPVSYEDMQARLRNEMISFSAGFSTNYMTDRVELRLSGRGGNHDEIDNVLRWMKLVLDSPYFSVDNLPRMHDYLDQRITAHRNRTKTYEEYWVDEVSAAYRYQKNPLILATGNFLTGAFNAQRLRCLLTDPGDDSQKAQWIKFMDVLCETGKSMDRDALASLMESLLSESPQLENGELASLYNNLPENVIDKVTFAARSINACMADIPDANLETDWIVLCQTIRDDVAVDPQVALDDINEVIELVKHADIARMYMISNSDYRAAALDNINNFVAGFSSEPSVHQNYASDLRIINRLKSRNPEAEKPAYAGLVFDGTNNGVLMGASSYANMYDTTTDAVLDRLSGTLYTGGAGHSLFMQTWGAGLAYSNGFGIGASGRMSYYAERCPDIAETMRFVVGILKNDNTDSTLKNYCVAQAFQSGRSASRYESRGAAMASDLADGISPETISNYRKKILEVKKRDDFFDQVKSRLDKVYGKLLVGYGASLKDMDDGTVFVIGPEAQFESFEEYIKTVEGKRPVYRLYPRDFWMTI